MFLAPKNFLGRLPQNFGPGLKIERSFKHRAKLCTDRLTELGDYARKKKKKRRKSQQNLNLLRKLSLPGGLIIT